LKPKERHARFTAALPVICGQWANGMTANKPSTRRENVLKWKARKN